MAEKSYKKTEQSLHIAFAIDGLHNISGGAERVLADVTRGLYERGHRITIFTHEERNGLSFYPLKFGIERVDLRPRHSRRKKRPRLDRVRGIGHRSLLLGIPIWLVQLGPKIFRLRRALRRIKPDVIVGFMPTMFPYTTIAAVGLDVKTVSSIHNVPTREFGSDKRRWNQSKFDISVRRLSLRMASALTVLLPSFKEEFSRKSVKDKTYIIPNMIHVHEGPFADVTKDASDNTILAVGRMADAKDHLALIYAWKRLQHKFPDWRVKIFGNGPLKNSLSKKVRVLELERIELCAPKKEIMAEYQSAKILAMPSKYEGFGLVTAEALSVGLPVVGFASCSGTNELVEPEVNGLLAGDEPSRVDAFAESLERLMVDDDLRLKLAANAPTTALRFAPEKVLNQWEELFFSLVSKDVSRD